MDADIQQRLQQINRFARNGVLGEEAQAATRTYDDLQPGLPVALYFIRDFYSPRQNEEDKQIASIMNIVVQLILVVYRDAKKHDESVAQALASSFLSDFPNAPGSCLFTRWESLIQASVAFKASVSTEAILIWQQALKLTQSYNEFLNGLLGYLIIGWQCACGKQWSTKTLKSSYATKVSIFTTLTGGDDGAFYLLLRLAQPSFRNAIAHEDIRLDSNAGIVRYRESGEWRTMPVNEVIYRAAIASHLGQAYLVALAVIMVFESEDIQSIRSLPEHLVQVLIFKADSKS